jgi:nascent polypeptide-associated complex subunit alpha
MFGKINPKQIEGMMKKMGIAQQNIDAKRVIIELEDENIIIDEPNVIKINMQGQESFQITGETRIERKEGFSEQDVRMVMEKTSAKKEEVIEFLKENNGDIALAIIELKR